MILNSLNIIDYSVVAVYLASMVVIGFLVTRFSKTDQDYFKGGNRIPWAMSSLSLFIVMVISSIFIRDVYKPVFSVPIEINKGDSTYHWPDFPAEFHKNML